MKEFYIFISFLIGFFLAYVMYVGITRSITMTIFYPDGSWIKGIRKSRYVHHETFGTHHYFVTDVSEFMDKSLIGKRVAIPINSVKYFIIEGK